jgi:hypothetical protein
MENISHRKQLITSLQLFGFFFMLLYALKIAIKTPGKLKN